jgi:hypothetical protein
MSCPINKVPLHIFSCANAPTTTRQPSMHAHRHGARPTNQLSSWTGAADAAPWKSCPFPYPDTHAATHHSRATLAATWRHVRQQAFSCHDFLRQAQLSSWRRACGPSFGLPELAASSHRPAGLAVRLWAGGAEETVGMTGDVEGSKEAAGGSAARTHWDEDAAAATVRQRTAVSCSGDEQGLRPGRPELMGERLVARLCLCEPEHVPVPSGPRTRHLQAPVQPMNQRPAPVGRARSPSPSCRCRPSPQRQSPSPLDVRSRYPAGALHCVHGLGQPAGRRLGTWELGRPSMDGLPQAMREALGSGHEGIKQRDETRPCALHS